jgi:hypothetical protein
MEGRLSGEKHLEGRGNVEAGIRVKTRGTPINLDATGKKVSRLHANNIWTQLFTNKPTNQTTNLKKLNPSSKAAGSSSTQ